MSKRETDYGFESSSGFDVAAVKHRETEAVGMVPPETAPSRRAETEDQTVLVAILSAGMAALIALVIYTTHEKNEKLKEAQISYKRNLASISNYRQGKGKAGQTTPRHLQPLQRSIADANPQRPSEPPGIGFEFKPEVPVPVVEKSERDTRPTSNLRITVIYSGGKERTWIAHPDGYELIPAVSETRRSMVRRIPGSITFYAWSEDHPSYVPRGVRVFGFESVTTERIPAIYPDEKLRPKEPEKKKADVKKDRGKKAGGTVDLIPIPYSDETAFRQVE